MRNYYGNKLPDWLWYSKHYIGKTFNGISSEYSFICRANMLKESHESVHKSSVGCLLPLVGSDNRKLILSSARELRLLFSGSTETASLRHSTRSRARLRSQSAENSVTWRRNRIGGIYKYKCNQVKCFPLPKQWSYCLSLFFINLSAGTGEKGYRFDFKECLPWNQKLLSFYGAFAGIRSDDMKI